MNWTVAGVIITAVGAILVAVVQTHKTRRYRDAEAVKIEADALLTDAQREATIATTSQSLVEFVNGELQRIGTLLEAERAGRQADHLAAERRSREQNSKIDKQSLLISEMTTASEHDQQRYSDLKRVIDTQTKQIEDFLAKMDRQSEENATLVAQISSLETEVATFRSMIEAHGIIIPDLGGAGPDPDASDAA